MPRDGSGNFTRAAGPYVASTLAQSGHINTEMDDMASALTASINTSGTKAFGANQPMGGFKLTGLAAGSSNGDSVRYEQLTALSGVYQPLDATLTALAALSWSSGSQLPRFTAADTVSLLSIGTSGGTIPLLNGANTHSGLNKFTSGEIRNVDDSAFYSFYNDADSTRSGYFQVPAAGDATLALEVSGAHLNITTTGGGVLKLNSNVVYYAGGTDVPVTDGGTGASSASGARTSLGLVIGTDVQAFDADLSALAANSTDGLWAHTGAGTGAARTITAGAGISVSNGNGVSGNPTVAADFATASEIRANTADQVLGTDESWDALTAVTLTDAATVAIDMSTFINADLTIGGNRTLGQPSNTKVGQSGAIRIIQDGAGSRTLAYHADWKFAGGVDPTLSTAAGSVDVLFYQVMAANFIYGSLAKALA